MKEVKVTVLTSKEFEEYTCVCGNTSADSGFFPCNAVGEMMEPNVGSGWTGLYACAECGNILTVNDDEERPIKVVDGKKIFKVKGKPGSKYCLAYWEKDIYTPWVTWGCNDAVTEFSYGNYFKNREDAEINFEERTKMV